LGNNKEIVFNRKLKLKYHLKEMDDPKNKDCVKNVKNSIESPTLK